MAKVYSFVKGEGLHMTDIFDVANYFLSCVDEEAGCLMTHLKLQKLCYYAQAWHLVFENRPMFNEHFEAWAHGPVSPDLWLEYKSYGRNPIDIPESIDISEISDNKLETLGAVWEAYGQFDAKYLEELTHREDPWIIARGDCVPGEICNEVIALEIMQEYYNRVQNQ